MSTSQLTDFVTDNNPKAVLLAQRLNMVPPYADFTDTLEHTKSASLQGNLYAHPALKLLPLHTKSAAFWSAAYYHLDNNWQGQPANIKSAVLTNIENAVQFHGIESDYQRIKTAGEVQLETETVLDAMEKSASADDIPSSKFAFVIAADDGTLQGYYPIHSQASVVKSAALLAGEYMSHAIPADMFNIACRSVVKAASTHGFPTRELPDVVLRHGTSTLVDFDKARHQVEMRKLAGLSTAQLEQYSELVETAELAYNAVIKSASSDALDSDLCEVGDQLVSAWDALDRDCAVKRGGRVLSPHDSVFSDFSMADIVKNANSRVTFDDSFVPIDIVASLSLDKLRADLTPETLIKVASIQALAREGKGLEASARTKQLTEHETLVVLQHAISL